MGTFYIQNFGCRATQADGAALERQFREQGLEQAETAAGADITVLNTCTVTASADQDARAAIRRIHRANPDCQIVVTGCYAQRAPQEIAALPGVSNIIGNSHKHQLAEMTVRPAAKFVPLSELSRKEPNGQCEIHVSDIFAHTQLLAAPVFDALHERTRPNLKIQDGCDNRCSFCVIPSVRGQSRSLPLERIIEEVRALVRADYREVVLSGINLGRWGRDLASSSDRPGFADLVREILEQTGIEKLRISSVEPMDWSDELIGLMKSSSRIARHAHIPLQSASDAVLRRMHRKYRPWHYREKIEKVHAALPLAAIGADVMVGFPGETDNEFEETRRFIHELPFTYLHVFTYSARPGTPAASMPQQVPVRVARERNAVLRELADQKKQEFMQKHIGTVVEAITLNVTGTNGDGVFTDALTDNYLKIRLHGRYQANRWIPAVVEAVSDSTLIGAAELPAGRTGSCLAV